MLFRSHYSQVLLVPKPDQIFRMCVDYRALNDCTPDASWPIPNTVGRGKSSTDWIFVRNIFNPSSDRTFPTNSRSLKPKKHLFASRYRLCFLNRSNTDRNRETNSILLSPKTLQTSICILQNWSL